MPSRIHRVTNLLQPLKIIPKNASIKADNLLSNSQKLMLENGIIRQSGNGMFHILPLGIKSLEKLSRIVDSEMYSVNAQKVLLPLLTDSLLWKKSGRWESATQELFKLTDRHKKEYLLSPTHEESVAGLIASITPVSHHHLPLRIYQISSKFRDEKKPRFGLIRGKEFLMKDLYTFDSSSDAAKTTYLEICEAYHKIFDKIGVKYVKVSGDNGDMGGEMSHEYHFLANIGEDCIVECTSCKYAANKEIFRGEVCPNCNKTEMKQTNGIEVGHTFLLGTRYSTPLGATFTSPQGESIPLEMGSYGIGLTRILAAAVETLSPGDEIRWPLALAPYSACIITPKDGSNEESATLAAYKMYECLNSIDALNGDVIMDDRGSMTIGKRLLQARKTGYPFVIVVGKKAMLNDPIFEIFNLCKDEQINLNLAETLDYFHDVFSTSDMKVQSVKVLL